MFIMTVGSFQVFIKRMTLNRVLQVKVKVFLKNLIFMFSVETIHFSLEDRYMRRLFVQNIEYNPSSFSKTDISHTSTWISQFFIDFHRFSWIFINFNRLHGFIWIYIDFHRFLWFFIDLRGSGARVFGGLWQPVAACGSLCRPVPPDWIPLILRLQILEACVWRPGAWMSRC